MSLIKLLLLAMIAAASVPALADDDGAPVTPYRPSISTPAQLPAPGQLELEMGGQFDQSSAGWRNSLPYTLKLAFTNEWGVVIGGEGFVSAPTGNGTRAEGIGDTSLTLKRAFLIDDATAFGLELTTKQPTAKDTIGSGEADYELNGIFSRDMGPLHMDINLNATRLGAYDAGTSDVQTGLASAFSTALNDKWGATAEVSGTRRNGAASTSQLLTALTYSVSKRMVIDFGVAKGLNQASGEWQVFSGIVIPLANLW